MKKIRRTSVYKKWIKGLRDSRARYRILTRIKRLEEGNPGDAGPVGEGVSELRIKYGPGYRVYYKDTGNEIVILLCGGDKSTQQADIAEAKRLAALPLEVEV
jgi:putative addiction module killer protein